MGIGAAVVGLLGTAYSVFDSERKEHKAEKKEKKLEEQEELRLAQAEIEGDRKNADRRRRLSLYGRQSTFSSFKSAQSQAGKTSIFGG